MWSSPINTPFSMLFSIISFFILMLIFIDIVHNSYNSLIGFRLIHLKAIHSEYGKFYLYIRISTEYGNVTEAYLYKDNFFYLTKITNFYFNGIEHLKDQINTQLVLIYGAEKQKKDFKNKIIKDIYKEWNGNTTKQLDRDEKIKKLI